MSEYFSEAQSAKVVNGRLEPDLRQIMEAFITHLQGFMKDVEPSTQE